MAKRRRKKPVNGQNAAPRAQKVQQAAESSVPKFEIGVKGDEFDLKYTRAAAAKTANADSLLKSLSKETRVSEYNLLNFAVLALLILLLALSFAFLSRSGSAPRFSASALADGSYAAELSEYYNDTLPFGRAIKTLGAHLGFCDMPEPLPEEELPPDEERDPEITTPTEPPEVTTAPTTAETPTSAPITEETEATVPETTVMYANGTVNVRLSPDNDAMIMGYFSVNEEVEVIRLDSDGWAMIWYNGMTAYVSSDYLGATTVATTKRTTVTTTTAPEEPEPEETTVPDEEDIETTATEETEPEVTTGETTFDREYYASLYGTPPPEYTATSQPHQTQSPFPENTGNG